MTISTKGRYALRIMMDLAGHMGETVKLKDIAARQDISEKYMEQIVAVLNKAGYVRSTRGAQGGYQLVRQPQQYTVGMILRPILTNNIHNNHFFAYICYYTTVVVKRQPNKF